MVHFEFWGCLVVSSFDYLCIIVFTFCTVVILTFYYSVIVMSQLFLHWVTARLFLFPFYIPILSPQSCLLSLSLGLCVHYFLFYFDSPLFCVHSKWKILRSNLEALDGVKDNVLEVFYCIQVSVGASQ